MVAADEDFGWSDWTGQLVRTPAGSVKEGFLPPPTSILSRHERGRGAAVLLVWFFWMVAADEDIGWSDWTGQPVRTPAGSVKKGFLPPASILSRHQRGGEVLLFSLFSYLWIVSVVNSLLIFNPF